MVFGTNINPKFLKYSYVSAFPIPPKCFSDKFKKFATSVCLNHRALPKVKILVSKIPTKALNLTINNCSYSEKAAKLTAIKHKYLN